MVLCHLHNDFLCCCIGVMCLQNDFWMSTKTLHDLKDYVEPSVFLCALTMSLCPPKTLCDLLQWCLTAFTMTLIFTVTSPLHSDPLWPFYWLSDLHTKIYLSLYSSTNNCCPQTMRSSVSLCGHQNACVQSKWLCESTFMTLCEPNNDVACHSQWLLTPSQRLVYPHMILFSQRFCVTIIVSLCMLTTNVTFTATLYTLKMSL